MKKLKLALLLSSLLTISQYAAADCRRPTGVPIITAPAIAVDLSTSLSSTSTPVIINSRTTFTGSFTCTAPVLLPNAVGVTSPFAQGRTATIGFNNNAQIVSITVTNVVQDGVTGLTTGSHSTSELDTNFTMQFRLVSTPNPVNHKVVTGTTITINPMMFASDATTLGLVGWLVDVIDRLVTFLLTLQWTPTQNDIILQPIQLTYNPILTTCNFANQGLVVTLPPVSINAVKTVTRAGYTPFTLNFTCKDFISGGNASRDVSMFLSNPNLLSTDKTVLTNTAGLQAAAGVGFRLVKADNINTPLVLSDSVTAQGTATNIFSVLKGNPISPTFSINMGAYYHPYLPALVTQGRVSSTATVVMSYN